MPAPQQNHFPLLTDFTAALTSSAYAKWQQLVDDYAHRAELAGECRRLADLAFTGRDAAARAHLHEVLAVVYAHEFSQSAARNPDQDSQPVLCDVTSILENAMLEHEFGQIPEELLSGYPTGEKEYVRWLKALIQDHPASTHPMYAEHLPTVATAEDIRFLLAQETSLDPRFDDILAVMQLGATGAEKMEIAANYWDEMGNGEFADVHTTLFSQCLTSIGVDQDYVEQNLLPIAKECGNISAGLALSRRHYLRAIGYYGVTEFLAPAASASWSPRGTASGSRRRARSTTTSTSTSTPTTRPAGTRTSSGRSSSAIPPLAARSPSAPLCGSTPPPSTSTGSSRCA
nr:iron-containing redox enzyme family protein [Streptomyces malaysiensis]